MTGKPNRVEAQASKGAMIRGVIALLVHRVNNDLSQKCSFGQLSSRTTEATIEDVFAANTDCRPPATVVLTECFRCERPHRRSQCRKLARDESLSSNGRPRPAPQLKAGNPILASRKDRVVAPGQFLCCARACSLQEARAEWRRSIQRCSDNLCQAQARAGRFPGPGI